MLGANIRGEDGCADDPPTKVASGQEVVGGFVFAFLDDPPRDATQNREVNQDHQPVNPGETGLAERHCSKERSYRIHGCLLLG
jgi:hypothetical protein